MGCSIKQCKSYGSVLDYEPADNDLVCKSGFTRVINGMSLCVPTPKILDKEGPLYKCASPVDTCKYEIPSKRADMPTLNFETPCKCGFTPNGDSFCPHVYTETFTTLLRDVTEQASSSCHTLNRADAQKCLEPSLINDEKALAQVDKLTVETANRLFHNEVQLND